MEHGDIPIDPTQEERHRESNGAWRHPDRSDTGGTSSGMKIKSGQAGKTGETGKVGKTRKPKILSPQSTVRNKSVIN